MYRTALFLSLAAVALSSSGGQSPLSQALGVAPAAHVARAGQPWTALIERVLDGDTVVVRGTTERVRLANIDAPEMSHGPGRPGQPFSVQATRWLERKVQGRAVTLRCPDQDRYGRPVCDLFVGGEYVNRGLVRAGLAWANTARPQYLRDRTVLEAQQKAQEGRRGLWRDRKPMAPWLWRHECWGRRMCAEPR